MMTLHIYIHRHRTKDSEESRLFSKQQKKRLIQKSGGKCEICGEKGELQGSRHAKVLEIHHKNHFANGGATTEENGQVLCRPCHVKVHQGVLK